MEGREWRERWRGEIGERGRGEREGRKVEQGERGENECPTSQFESHLFAVVHPQHLLPLQHLSTQNDSQPW